MLRLLNIFLLLNYIGIICSNYENSKKSVMLPKDFMIWPNATIPFYIEPQHFDHEQSLAIMKTLSMFAFKTCLKFAPVMDRPKDNEHVMLFVNPDGVKRCKIETTGHSVFSPHSVHLGYECLKSPQIEMMIMRALGFPFEHNRLSRDLYIQPLIENIEPSAIDLYAKDTFALPLELQVQPYDVNSVMHFGVRDHSKNGHRTIEFRRSESKGVIKQNRVGLTATDLKKIEIVYGSECLQRDRQEKIELCHTYPGVVRRKRDVETPTSEKSLRINPDITPSEYMKEHKKDVSLESEISKNLNELGIEEEAQDVLENIYKAISKALKTARDKYCKSRETYKSINFGEIEVRNRSDALGMIAHMMQYVDSMIANSMNNMTVFCKDPDSMVAYQRYFCDWRFDSNCITNYRSTKSGNVKYSTNHRPFIRQSTNHDGQGHKYSYDKMSWRATNDTNETTTSEIQVRRKREYLDDKNSSASVDHAKDVSAGKVEESKRNLKSGSSVVAENRRRLYFENQQDKSIKDPTNTQEDEPVFQVSAQINEGILTLDTDLVKHSPPVDMTSDKEVEQDKSVNPVQRGQRDEKSIVKKEKKHIRKKKKSANTFVGYAYPESSHIELPKTVSLTKLNREFYNDRRWSEGVIRYVISPLEGYDLDDMRSRLEEVINILKMRTCVTLKEVTAEEAMDYEDYLVLDTSPDYVTGRVGGKQHFGCVELFRGGQHRQHAAMMVMAMLGFYFEVSRYDRDKYIRVHMRHVRPDKLHHFEKLREDATLDLPYDYRSATHPAWQFWRKIGKTGISTVATFKSLDPNGTIMRSLGQHHKILSEFDIIKINSVYGVDCFLDEQQTES